MMPNHSLEPAPVDGSFAVDITSPAPVAVAQLFSLGGI
jgi:hypothetical protein